MKIRQLGLAAFFLLFLLTIFPGQTIAQNRNFGIYTVNLTPEWTFSQESSGADYSAFRSKTTELILKLYNNPEPCPDLPTYNKLIMSKVQEAGRRQEIIEQRKPTFPCQILGQKSCHMMVLRSRESESRRMVLHIKAGNQLYQFEVAGNLTSTELPASALQFFESVGLSDGSYKPAAAVAASSDESNSASTAKAGESKVRDESLSGYSKVKTSADTRPISPQTSISGMTSATGGGLVLDLEAAEKAAKIPDGDKMDYVVNPAGTPQPVAEDAGWAAGLAKNPAPLIDALEGGRPGGEVNALIALMRQAQGITDENEDNALMSQYAAHAAAGSPKTKKAIRAQSELLLQAMIHRQLMMQAAWEYDFALSQMQVAEALQDEDEMMVARMLAEVQQGIVQEQQTALQQVVKKSEAAPKVPTAAEVIQEQQQMIQLAENAAFAVNTSGTAGNAASAGNDKNAADNDAAMVARYHALRQEHRMLVESMGEGSAEATAVYREAMEIRRKLEAKGIDVFNYKSPANQAQNNEPYKEEPYFIPSNPDPRLTPEQNQAIAEHEQNINAAIRVLNGYRRELAAAQTPEQREELRLLALHMEQNIHDSKDLIASIRTGTIVKTRGPWDEHSAVVLAETSRKLREDFQRASQMQASYARMLNLLSKHNPQEAAKFREQMANNVIKGIFEPGGFDKAQQAINALYAVTKTEALNEQRKLEAQQEKAFERLEMVERHLRYAETLKSGCDKAIFVGTIFTGMVPGLILSMGYEGFNTAFEKTPEEAIKNMATQGATTLLMMGTFRLGSWGISKLLNPKVAQSEINTFRNVIENARLQQETEWNQALVNQLKERVNAFNKAKASGGAGLMEARKALDESVAICNSSSLAKMIMKNELNMLEKQVRSGATRDLSKLRECLSYQKVFEGRLHDNIYPRTDLQMIKTLRAQGYNVEASWFQEFRNASSRGINADRDLGLLAQFERKVTKNGQPVSMSQFMKEAEKAYDASYKAVTGRSARLADQNITTSAHGESFPLSWLKKKMEGPFNTLEPPVTPRDFQKAGDAIYNKVKNAYKGTDPEFVKMKKACASLSKDLKTKVFQRLQSPPPGTGLTPTARQSALEHWSQVQKVLEDFATDQSDPFSTMKKLQQLTGSTSISDSAAKLKNLLNKLGG